MATNERRVRIKLVLPESDPSKNVVIPSQLLWRFTHLEEVAKKPKISAGNAIETFRNK
jgi:hypothetical protein